MNINYLTIPLLSLNIILSAFVAQKVFYVNSVDVVTENEETQGECFSTGTDGNWASEIEVAEVKGQSEPTSAVQPVKPQEVLSQNYVQFETCIYNETNSNIIYTAKVMQCNVGNTLEMKKCLVDAGGRRSHVDLKEAVSCWRLVHYGL